MNNGLMSKALFEKRCKQLKQIKGTDKCRTFKLDVDQKRFIEKELGLKVEPYLYSVRTRTFMNVSELPQELLILHYSKKHRNYTKVMKLTEEEKKLFKKYGVKFEILTYKITDPKGKSQLKHNANN
jgi:hypothetical protein